MTTIQKVDLLPISKDCQWQKKNKQTNKSDIMMKVYKLSKHKETASLFLFVEGLLHLNPYFFYYFHI